MFFYLKQSEANNLEEWSWRSEDSLKLFASKVDKVGMVQTPSIKISPDSMPYCLL